MEDNKIVMLMDHVIHHNEHHAEDFESIARDLKDAGVDDAAELAKSAAEDIKGAVKKLVEARDIYKKSL